LVSLNNSVPSFGGQAPHAFEWGTSGAAISGVINNGDSRTGYFGEGSVSGIVRDALSVYSDKIIVDYAGNLEPAYAVINNTYVTFDPVKSFTINASSYPYKNTSVNYCSVFVLTSSGVVKTVNSLVGNTNPSVASSDVVLGYVNFTIVNGTITPISVIFTDVTINTNGYQDFSFGISNKSDFYVATQSTLTGYSSSIKISFPGTNDTADNTNYTQYRKFKMFYHLRDLIDNVNIAKVCMLVDATNFAKYSLEDASITNIVESRSLDKSFVLNTNIPLADLTDILNGFLVFYTKDNEFILGQEKVITTNDVATSTTGVVGKYSDFYATYYDGDINTGDFFYDNRLYLDSSNGSVNVLVNSISGVAETVDVIFVNGENCPSQDIDYSGYNYIVFKNVNFSDVALASDEQIIIPSSELNNLVFTIGYNSVQPTDTATDLATALGYDNTSFEYFAYEVVENVVDEELTSVDLIYDVNSKHYLKMYLDSNGNLYTDFTDVLLESTSTIDTIANNTVYVQSDKSNLKQTIEIEQATGYVSVPNKILVNGSRYTELKVGDFLEADTTSVTLEVGQTFKRKLTRVLSKRQYAGNTALSEITCDSAIKRTVFNGDYQTTRYSSIDQYASTYKAITLKGFKIREASMPNGTEDRQSKVLNLVAKGTPLFKALTNKEAIDFRYLVDSFGLGLTERSKQQLVDICGERLDVFGFINMPSIRSFKNSSSPSFVNSEGVLQAEFIAKGGDPESNPAFLYSFGDGDGVTSVGYFTPYVVVNDNGRPLDFPPASFAATTYIRKHISNVSSVTPWTIAAGVTNGKITNIAGLEIDFDPSDIEFLNPAQINPIVLKRNRGYVIETENTALTLYKSALSYIHVREVLIELERELSRMLLDYQWKFNTPDVRSEIKLRADVICETYVSKNGLYNYFNKMDDENNTAEVIDNQIGVLDTYVEPIKGMGIIVNNITILRTGAIAAGGFLNA
jgi:hypothetical protein